MCCLDELWNLRYTYQYFIKYLFKFYQRNGVYYIFSFFFVDAVLLQVWLMLYRERLQRVNTPKLTSLSFLKKLWTKPRKASSSIHTTFIWSKVVHNFPMKTPDHRRGQLFSTRSDDSHGRTRNQSNKSVKEKYPTEKKSYNHTESAPDHCYHLDPSARIIKTLNVSLYKRGEESSVYTHRFFLR